MTPLNERLLFDTNVLLDEPLLLARFQAEGRLLIIPLCVLEELDALKLELSERGQRARALTHALDELCAPPAPSDGLLSGLALPGGGHLLVSDAGHEGVSREHDQALLACLKALSAQHQAQHQGQHQAQKQVTLITQDVNLRVRARFYGLSARPPELTSQEAPPSRELTSEREGAQSIQSVQAQLEALESAGALNSAPAWGLSPINDEQRLALHVLRDPSVSLVCLTGKAGTGKTLIALAAGLAQCLEGERLYERLLVSRAIFPLGKDIGYLPGTLEEKMAPWVQPIYDNLDFLLNARPQRQPHRARASSEELFEMGVVEVTPITYIRGRSIPKQYMIIDEAQNLTQHEVKTIITRAGVGTKLVLIGDTAQIDHPYLNEQRNGLSHVIERFKGQACAAHVHLTRGERSALAALAADLL